MTVDSGEEQTRRPGDEVDPETSWVGRARKAIALGRDIGEVELVETNPPPLADVAFELSAIALAGVAWAGAAFREIVAGQPLDPIALLLRALAFGLTLRAGVAVARAARRLRLCSPSPPTASSIARPAAPSGSFPGRLCSASGSKGTGEVGPAGGESPSTSWPDAGSTPGHPSSRCPRSSPAGRGSSPRP